MKARDVLGLIFLWIGLELVTWGDEIGKVAGVVFTALFGVYYIGRLFAPTP